MAAWLSNASNVDCSASVDCSGAAAGMAACACCCVVVDVVACIRGSAVTAAGALSGSDTDKFVIQFISHVEFLIGNKMWNCMNRGVLSEHKCDMLSTFFLFLVSLFHQFVQTVQHSRRERIRLEPYVQNLLCFLLW